VSEGRASDYRAERSGKFDAAGDVERAVQPDSGDVAIRKGTQVRCVLQISEFAPGETIQTVIDKALDQAKVAESERLTRIAEILGRAEFTDLDAEAATLSVGGAAAAIVGRWCRAGHLLLDEPTIIWTSPVSSG